MKKLLSVVIPCFNEEDVIEKTNKTLINILKSIEESYNWEIVYVNDGSKDKTLDLLKKITQKDKRIKVINFSKNFGHQAALTCGMKNCNGDYCIVMDADLQHPPELIPKILQKREEEDANIVYMIKQTRDGEGFVKKHLSNLYYSFINSISDTKMTKNSSDFRLVDRKVLNEFCKLKEKNKYIRGLIPFLGFKSVSMQYNQEERAAGEAKYTLLKSLKLALSGITSFSKKPLHIPLYLGIGGLFFGLGLIIYVCISIFMFKNTKFLEHGWASLMMTITIFGSANLLSIGIVGLYISNIFEESKGRQEYIIDTKFNLD